MSPNSSPGRRRSNPTRSRGHGGHLGVPYLGLDAILDWSRPSWNHGGHLDRHFVTSLTLNCPLYYSALYSFNSALEEYKYSKGLTCFSTQKRLSNVYIFDKVCTILGLMCIPWHKSTMHENRHELKKNRNVSQKGSIAYKIVM